MHEETKARPGQDKPDFDSLIADLFGLNVRGAKTLYHLFAFPKRVFESARVYDWQSQYTPTMRLAFSILTVFSLLSFFWAAEDGVLYQTLLAQFSEAFADDPDAPDVNLMIDAMFAGYNFIYPFAYMIIHALVASLVFIWGKGTSWVARIRLYFSVASAGIAISVASILFMPLVNIELVWIASSIGMALSFLAYIIIYARGMAGNYSTAGLMWRAFSIANIVVIADLTVAIVAGTGGSMWANMQVA